MQILINADQDILSRIKLCGVSFNSLDAADNHINKEDAVLVIRYDSSFGAHMVMAGTLAVPVIVLAGCIEDKGQAAYQTALAGGVREAGIIYKDGVHLYNHLGYRFSSPVQNGVGPAAVAELARFAWNQCLVPECIVLWNPDEMPVTNKVIETSVAHLEPGKRMVEKDGIKNLPKSQIDEKELADFLDDCHKIILAIRTLPVLEGSGAAGRLAHKLNALHIEVSRKASSFRAHHPDSLELAIKTGNYAFSDGKRLSLKSNHVRSDFLLVEIELSELPPALLDELHERAEVVVHIPTIYKECRILLEDWMNAGGKLNAIIPEDVNDTECYAIQFPGLTKSVEDFAALIEARL